MRIASHSALCFMLGMSSVFASGDGEQLSLQKRVLASPESAKSGERIFNSTCAYCHGHRGRGGQGRPLNKRSFEAGRWFKIISEGRTRGSKRMPSFEASLNEEQRWQLIAYLQTLNDNHDKAKEQ